MKGRYCTNCGSEIPPEAAFCPFCGHAVSKDGEPDDSFTFEAPKVRETQSTVLAVLSFLSLSVVSFALSLYALVCSRRTKKALRTGETGWADEWSARSLKMLRWGVCFLLLHWLLLAGLYFLHTPKADNIGRQYHEIPAAQADVGTTEEKPEELLEDAARHSLQEEAEQASRRQVEALSGTGEKPEKVSKELKEATPKQDPTLLKQHPALSKRSPTLLKQSPTLSKQHPTLSKEDLEKEEETALEMKQNGMSSTGGRTKQEGGVRIFDFVEQPPVFPGGGDAAVLKWINSHLRYPQEAKENGIQGTVLLRFVVTKTGSVGDVQILKHVDPLLDREAVRVVKELPKFNPGRQSGKPVDTWFQVPVRFQME